MKNRILTACLFSLGLSAPACVPPPAQNTAPLVTAPTPVYQYPTQYPAQQQPGARGVQFGATNWGEAVATQAPIPVAPQVSAGQVSTAGIVAPVQFRNVEQTGIRVAYGPTQNYAQIRQAFQDARVFEQIADTMNRIIAMPRILDIQMAECGTVNAFYDPANHRIIMCYEMVAHTFKTFSKVNQNQEQVAQAGVYASIFIFFHEFGHAMRDILDLPVTGREEDAVDQFSTMLLIDADAHDAVLMGAHFFGLESARYANTQAEKLPFWDEHSLEQQRFYNILCLLYGSDPNKYQNLVDQSLPKSRAQRCPAEFKNIDAAWTRLLAPHLTQEATTAIQNGTQLNAPLAPPPAPVPQRPVPQRPAPQVAQANCQMVGQKVVQLIMYESQGQLTPQEQQTFQQQLSQMHYTIIAECQNKQWTAASKQCVMQAQSLAQAQGCD